MNPIIRKLKESEFSEWQNLWDGYTRFYEREPDKSITEHLWNRIFDDSVPLYAVVAEHEQQMVGFMHYIIHENTSTLSPVCYLQDLYVSPDLRAGGIGQQLIDWLIDQGEVNQWSRVYWNTKENNYRARGLYDKYTPHSGFLRYVVEVEKPD